MHTSVLTLIDCHRRVNKMCNGSFMICKVVADEMDIADYFTNIDTNLANNS